VPACTVVEVLNQQQPIQLHDLNRQ
jgi:hypothetical protein